MVVLHGIARSVSRSVMTSLWKHKYTQRGAFNLLKELGHTYPEKTFRADWREMAQGKQRERFFRAMPRTARPIRATMVEKATPVGHEYVYTFDTNILDPKTEKLYEHQLYSIGSERVLTIQEAEDKLAEMIARYPEELEYVAGVCTNVKRK